MSGDPFELVRHTLLEGLDDETLAQLRAAFELRAARCAARNYNEEGIPMFLVLEDVSGDAEGLARRGVGSGEPSYNRLLATALELFADFLAVERGRLEPKDINLVLEVLADAYFAPNAAQSGESARS